MNRRKLLMKSELNPNIQRNNRFYNPIMLYLVRTGQDSLNNLNSNQSITRKRYSRSCRQFDNSQRIPAFSLHMNEWLKLQTKHFFRNSVKIYGCICNSSPCLVSNYLSFVIEFHPWNITKEGLLATIILSRLDFCERKRIASLFMSLQQHYRLCIYLLISQLTFRNAKSIFQPALPRTADAV